MLFSKALLNATYQNGVPGKLTEAHEKAEHHRFKTQQLFKDKIIPKDVYIARLIQHYVILKDIESRLQNMPENCKSEISAFFTLAYLEQLWRTPGIENDLQQLGVTIDKIQDQEIANTTKIYRERIEKLSPKALLAHFLFHVAGFMHGGNIIRSKYIEPSNRLTHYQIATEQYDFSKVLNFLPTQRQSPMVVYQDMMDHVDQIELTDEEYQQMIEQGKDVYETMAGIYDDLSDIHMHHPQLYNLSAFVCFVMVVLELWLCLQPAHSNAVTNHTMFK